MISACTEFSRTTGSKRLKCRSPSIELSFKHDLSVRQPSTLSARCIFVPELGLGNSKQNEILTHGLSAPPTKTVIIVLVLPIVGEAGCNQRLGDRPGAGNSEPNGAAVEVCPLIAHRKEQLVGVRQVDQAQKEVRRCSPGFGSCSRSRGGPSHRLAQSPGALWRASRENPGDHDHDCRQQARVCNGCQRTAASGQGGRHAPDVVQRERVYYQESQGLWRRGSIP